MSITDSCPCYPHYTGLQESPSDPFFPPPLTDDPPASPDEIQDVELTLLNADFDLATGNHFTPDNWTSEPTGDKYFRVDNGAKGIDPASEPYSAMGGNVADCVGTSTAIDLLAADILAAHIDTGQRYIRVEFQYASHKDQGAIGFNFLDSSLATISSKRDDYYADTYQAWQSKTFRALVPTGTRHVQVFIDLVRVSGDTLNANFDDLVVTYEDLINTVISTTPAAATWAGVQATIE